ncbi:putative RNA-directed DNA polymerase from transposon X-element [Araneus ventricosus]|uniref:Putative RNA-directed DNA polymerase from transposon X-element n=1 Tax=Araneus ventricosus TaxID=182803 RepID=A0A4Y2VDI7_ARAVE|nr:putative RNA-directed DNA polymerase from transposon X-element [Araneus ventricosus]
MMNNDKLKIIPPTSEAHKAKQNRITQDGMKSHTYELNDEKQIKVVIRGLSKDFDTSVIISHLQNQGFAPILCHPIRNRLSNTNFNFFLVTLPKILKSNEIYQIEFIGRMRVTIESLRKKQSPGQCYNCQEYFHHSRLCTRNPRCMKCAGPHRSRECPKPKDTPPKCLHCNGPHTTNFTGCPKNPVNRRTFPEAPENAWADPAIIAKIEMPPTPAVEPNPNPTTQLIPRPVQLASNANPPTQEVFFKQMSQMIWNAAGIKNKINQLKYFLLDWKPDVLALQETHLNPRDTLKFPNYSSYRTNRLTHRLSGTEILIRNSIYHHPTPIASTTFENTTIELHLPDSTPITISSIYRPPHGSISTLELNNIFNSNSKCITVGDFNAKHRAWSWGTWNCKVTIIHDYICNKNLFLLAPCEPTHFPNHSNNPSTLDFGNLKNFSSGDANSINALSSDRNPVSFEIDINVNLPAISKIIKTTNWSKFKQIMSTSLPGNPNIQDIKDIDEVITKLNSAILTAINLPPDLNSLMIWQQTYDPRYRRTANRLTNQIRLEIRDYDQENWKEWLMSLNQEDNSIYIAARKFSRKYIQIPPILDTNGIKYNPLGKSNAFKYSLENSFQTNPEPYDDVHIDEVNRAIHRYIDNPKPSSNTKLTLPQEILPFLKKINPRKTTGPDGIPNKALQQIPNNVITFITKIFNKCLLCNYFPTIWKTAHVLMFPKPRQNRKLPGNYRPISLLSNICKIFEKIILSRLKEECHDLSIIPNEQYGFRAGHGCIHQLLRVTNTVTQVILINYLRKRKFRVQLNHTLSDIGSTKAGTPQGSILSPLLYTIYTSDFPKTKQIINCFFADDTAILAQGTTINYVIHTLQKDLKNIEKWCTLWRVAINTDKTHTVMFRKGKSRKKLKALSFFDEDLTWDKEVKYLGLILDDKLTFRSHLQ